MSKKSTETQAAAELLAEQGDKIDSIYWEALDHEAVITHPALQQVLSDHLKRMIDHFTYMRCGALHDHRAQALRQGDSCSEGRDRAGDEVVRDRRGTERLHGGSHVLLLRS